MASCLIIGMEFFPIIGGAGSNAVNLARGLAGLGLEVDVLTYDFGQDCRDFDSRQSYGIIRLGGGPPAKRLDWFSHAARLAWWLARRGRKYDRILLADWVADVLMNIAYPLIRLPYAIYVHGSEINAFRHRYRLRLLTKGLYQRTGAFLCNSQYTRGLLEKSFPESKEKKICVVNVAVDFPSLATEPSRREWVRQMLGLTAEDFTLFQLSRVVDRKGHRQVIEALAGMTDDQKKSLVYLVGGSGPDSGPLRELATRLGLGNTVRFLGRLPAEELPGYYDACDVFVMPSLEARNRVEGFGAVYVEAALRGKPSIGSWHGAVPEVVLDGETGLLADTADPADLREKILRLRSNTELLQRMGRMAEKRAKDTFSLRRVSRRVALCLGLTGEEAH